MRNPRLALLLMLVATNATPGEVRVVGVDATPTGRDIYRFDVTLAHADSGWDHYADRWEVLTTEGVMLGTRVLHHPHVHEQPFTRSLGGVEVPAGTTRILIRARDSVHGYGDPPFALELPR